ncbi:hemin uptake protein HemP [Halorhodospira abdelmalekii]|uniref:hemin uptake protein HemP n=1 Tax=Halorhodospira abdelmalekii TaxID=421629 RepID=UPI003B847DF6
MSAKIGNCEAKIGGCSVVDEGEEGARSNATALRSGSDNNQGAVLAAKPRGAGSVRLNSRDLFGDARQVIIEHGQEEYRLQRTRQGRLILTK